MRRIAAGRGRGANALSTSRERFREAGRQESVIQRHAYRVSPSRATVPRMKWRTYDQERDRQAAQRIWYEVGWLRPERTQPFELACAAGRTLLAEVDGAPECLVLTSGGAISYLGTDLPFSGVTSVSTSRVGRRQGLASRLTARAIALDVSEGAAVAGLGMFDQGYYDRLGFGSGGYEHLLSFDPIALNVKGSPRSPERLTPESWQEVHAARVARPRRHGGLLFNHPGLTRVPMVAPEHAFGLGYFSSGKLTHHFWGHPEGESRANGPLRVQWMCYSTREQLLELLSLLRELGDQVLLIRMHQPPGIQLQDLIARPLRHYMQTGGGRFEMRNEARAYWQMRICDLERCIAASRAAEDVAFNLELEDPIESYLDSADCWRGVGGSYVVNLGRCSQARRGSDPGLQTLSAEVGAFTRMWLGVLPATGLAITGRMRGPQDLLERLDRALLLPQPQPDWDF
jgi:hypothetical protein